MVPPFFWGGDVMLVLFLGAQCHLSLLGTTEQRDKGISLGSIFRRNAGCAGCRRVVVSD